MPKATLTFNLPEDQAEYDLCCRASLMASIIEEWTDVCRNKTKYATGSTATDWEDVRKNGGISYKRRTMIFTEAETIRFLKGVILDIFWMARRYADGRQTYAPHMYNEAIKMAQNLGIEFPLQGTDGTIWAEDGDNNIRSH